MAHLEDSAGPGRPSESKFSHQSDSSETRIIRDDPSTSQISSDNMAAVKKGPVRPDPAGDPHRKPVAVRQAYEKTNYWKFIKEKKYWPWWGVLIVLAVLVILMTVYHKNIVDWLQPVSARIRSLSWGWIIPILILIALSFPPLFGHEIIIVLCGAVYGLWIGFGIVAAGTFIGEICTYFAFKTVLRKRAERLEQKNLDYGALARITREGGFWIVFIVRLSVVPGHFSTAVFATCGVSFWAFALASFVTLPKQLVIVYLGVIIGNPSGGRLVSNIVLGITFLITVLAAIYIWWLLQRMRKKMIAEAEDELEREGRLVGGDENTARDREDELEMLAAEEEMQREQEDEMRERERRRRQMETQSNFA